MDYDELCQNVDRAAENYRTLKCTIKGGDCIPIVEVISEDSIGLVELESVEQVGVVAEATRRLLVPQAMILNADTVLGVVDALSEVPEELSQALVTMGISAEGAYVIRLQTYWATETGLAFEVVSQPPEAPFLPVLAELQGAFRNAL